MSARVLAFPQTAAQLKARRLDVVPPKQPDPGPHEVRISDAPDGALIVTVFDAEARVGLQLTVASRYMSAKMVDRLEALMLEVEQTTIGSGNGE